MTRNKNRDMLPGVVGAGIFRVAAVICGNHQDILGLHFFKESTQPYVKLVKRLSVSLRVAAVPELHVEIHKICKAESVERNALEMRCFIHVAEVADITDIFCKSLSGEDIVYLADPDGVEALTRKAVKHCILRGNKRKIVSARRSGKRELTFKRTCDNAPHGIFSRQYLPRHAAVVIERFDRNYRFMSGYLEHAVCRSVDDEVSRADMFLAVVGDYLCSAVRFVAEYSPAGRFAEFLYDLLGEPVRKGRKWLFGYNSGDLPVAGCSVLAAGAFRNSEVRSSRICDRRADCNPVDVEKSQLLHVRHAEPASFKA